MDNITIVKRSGETNSLNIEDLTKIIINGETIFEKPKPLYQIIAIIGPSGCGKTTIMDELSKPQAHIGIHFHHLRFSTSRPRRMDEPGDSYYFYNKKDFEDMIGHDDMVQYSMFNNWYYGLEESELSTVYPNVGIFSPGAIEDLRKSLGNKADIKIVYIAVPEKIRLMRCLQREANPDIEEIIRRYNADKKDFLPAEVKNYYMVLANTTKEDLNDCVQKISDILYNTREIT